MEFNWYYFSRRGRIQGNPRVETFITFLSDINDYLKKLRYPIECLQQRMQKVENNLVEMESVLAVWDRLPLFERKESKKDTVFCLDERADRISRRYADIETASTRIQA